jgi:hypothetical protein
MTRFLAAAVLIALGGAVAAQPPADAPAPQKADPPRPLVVTLTVSPAAAPVPALKYELLPKLRDRTPGNAALEYHRAYMARPTWPRDPDASRKQDEMVMKWEESPVEKLPVNDVKKFLAGYAGAFKTLDQGARSDRCDWQLNRKLDPDHLMLLLPEVQAHRELARFQKLRIRLDLAENDFDAAVQDIQTGYRLGKDVGEGPMLIQMLVGIAIAGVFTDTVDQFIQRPGAPNLYWALTALPRPFIDPRPALEGEVLFFEGVFPNIREFEKGPVSAERANLMLDEMLRSFTRYDADPRGNDLLNVLGKFGLAAYVGLHYKDAKAELIAAGRPAEQVEKMPPAQVVVLRAVGMYRSLSDDQAKCFSLPYPQARAELARVRERAKRVIAANETDVLVRMIALTLPATEKVYEAFARTERRFAGLRAVEAVRMHAAANNGQLPRSLADVTLVPVPDDPNTGKPFEFAAAGNAFTLIAPPPEKEEPHSANSFRYEVSLRK